MTCGKFYEVFYTEGGKAGLCGIIEVNWGLYYLQQKSEKAGYRDVPQCKIPVISSTKAHCLYNAWWLVLGWVTIKVRLLLLLTSARRKMEHS